MIKFLEYKNSFHLNHKQLFLLKTGVWENKYIWGNSNKFIKGYGHEDIRWKRKYDESLISKL